MKIIQSFFAALGLIAFLVILGPPPTSDRRDAAAGFFTFISPVQAGQARRKARRQVRRPARRTARRTSRRTTRRVIRRNYLRTLPANCGVVRIGGIRYWRCGSLYYQSVIRDGATVYIVVDL